MMLVQPAIKFESDFLPKNDSKACMQTARCRKTHRHSRSTGFLVLPDEFWYDAQSWLLQCFI